MEGFTHRLQNVLDYHGITGLKPGKYIDFSNAAIGNMLADKTNPSCELRSRLMELFPMLNANWLVIGRGDMFIDEQHPTQGHRIEPLRSARSEK
jgi:hypothetical protein